MRTKKFKFPGLLLFIFNFFNFFNFIFFHLILFENHSLFAQEKNQKVFTVGINFVDAYPHYSYLDGKFKGFAMGILDLFAKKSGFKFQFIALPEKSLEQKFFAGEIDFRFPDHDLLSPKLKEEFAREKNKALSYLVFHETVEGVMVLPEKMGKGKDSLKSLGNLMEHPSPVWDKIVESGSTTYISTLNNKGLIELLLERKVDGILLDIPTAKHLLKTFKLEGAVVFDKDLPYTQSELKLSTWKHPELMEQIKKFMESESSAIEALKREHGLTRDLLFMK